MARSPVKKNTAEAPLFDHLEELRTRIVISIGYWAVGMGVAWSYRTQLLAWFEAPIHRASTTVNIVVMQLTDQLIMSLNLAFWGGLALALPFVLHQVWLFVAPGLYPEERRWAVPFVIGAGLMFGLGVIFGYYALLPNMVPFLLDFLGGGVTVNLDVAKYIGTIIALLVALGAVFELPVLSFVLTKIGIVNARLLGRLRKIAFVVILLAAAIITPTPDPFNMMIVALPVYVLYELGIIISRLAAPRDRLVASDA
ncbi:twin-arginine translocase subunit TatC [Deinococcus yavapaiensis]|uniref:Sec-independent protein translocase protein TatC n=1 Tax=Deinococcus yavapaiensis KR-236 TaxID=694435 RepID=A0A318S3T0_9DEIO|nr:twin-arginine translocase subunit TatC [Deinococcus yavapaiensis]PYE53059.1 Sec-independent protein translocase TatC [Deinococcus yavapaiensis KR-236]